MPYAPEGATRNMMMMRRMHMERMKEQKRNKGRKNIHVVHNDTTAQKSAITQKIIF
jgi:hypothetical protein